MQNVILDVQQKLSGCSDFRTRAIPCNGSPVTVLYIADICNEQELRESVITPLCNPSLVLSDVRSAQLALHIAFFEEIKTADEALNHILHGETVVFFPSLNYAVRCDTKKLQSRNIQKHELEANLRGPKESFNERLSDNLSLVRKRISNPALKTESFLLGTQSKTSAVLLYLDGIAPPELVDQGRKVMQNLKSTFATSVFPIAEELKEDASTVETTGYSEKPDKIVATLFEGRVVFLVDGSPFALYAPYFFVESFQSPDDYYSLHVESSLIRILRLLAFLIAITVPGMFIALTTQNISLLPTKFMFKLAAARAGVPFPTVIELLLMQFFFELAREAGKRLPEKIGQSLSVVAGLILGQAAVELGLASPATVVITGVYAICSFINPRLISTTLLWSITITSCSAMFALHGFYLSLVCFFARISSLRSCGYPFMFPLGTVGTFKKRECDTIFRGKLKNISTKILQRNNG